MSKEPEFNMPFLEHLSELRTCLLHVCIAIFAASILSFMWANELFSLLCNPILDNFEGVDLIGTGPAEAFIVKLKVAFFSGIILASPISFYKLWDFISPGLYENEKKSALPFVLASTFFFLLGVTFCYFLIFPFAFNFFQAEFESIGITPTIKIGEYLSFIVKLLLVFGVAFEMPVITFLLTKLKVINSELLVKKARYAIIAIFVTAAILTPPDVLTQVLLALPLILLYGLCILIAQFVEKKREEGVTP